MNGLTRQEKDHASRRIRLGEPNLVPILSALHISRIPVADITELINDAIHDPNQANMFMRMYYLTKALGQRELALDMQMKALALHQTYRIQGPEKPEIRLLALLGPGDMMDNTPLEFLIEDNGIRLDLLYFLPGLALPKVIPDHDVAFVALSESEANHTLLDRMELLFASWPRPILNRPAHVLRCARDTASQLLGNVPGLHIPATKRMAGGQISDVATPFIIRPLDTHAGKGLAKISDRGELKRYLDEQVSEQYYVADYIDYRSKDGLFRKYRVALIDGQPYLAHLAISEHWMVHYNSAGMAESDCKRAEEAAAMANFDSDFAVRHGPAFSAMHRILGLDYLVIDCAETLDGQLLVFEIDIAGLIHATDPIEIFPYKAPNMAKTFAAFKAMLAQRQAGTKPTS